MTGRQTDRGGTMTQANQITYRQVKLNPQTGAWEGGMYSIGPDCATIELARITPGLSSIGDTDHPRGVIRVQDGEIRNYTLMERIMPQGA